MGDQCHIKFDDLPINASETAVAELQDRIFFSESSHACLPTLGSGTTNQKIQEYLEKSDSDDQNIGKRTDVIKKDIHDTYQSFSRELIDSIILAALKDCEDKNRKSSICGDSESSALFYNTFTATTTAVESDEQNLSLVRNLEKLYIDDGGDDYDDDDDKRTLKETQVNPAFRMSSSCEGIDTTTDVQLVAKQSPKPHDEQDSYVNLNVSGMAKFKREDFSPTKSVLDLSSDVHRSCQQDFSQTINSQGDITAILHDDNHDYSSEMIFAHNVASVTTDCTSMNEASHISLDCEVTTAHSTANDCMDDATSKSDGNLTEPQLDSTATAADSTLEKLQLHADLDVLKNSHAELNLSENSHPQSMVSASEGCVEPSQDTSQTTNFQADAATTFCDIIDSIPSISSSDSVKSLVSECVTVNVGVMDEFTANCKDVIFQSIPDATLMESEMDNSQKISSAFDQRLPDSQLHLGISSHVELNASDYDDVKLREDFSSKNSAEDLNESSSSEADITAIFHGSLSPTTSANGVVPIISSLSPTTSANGVVPIISEFIVSTSNANMAGSSSETAEDSDNEVYTDAAEFNFIEPKVEKIDNLIVPTDNTNSVFRQSITSLEFDSIANQSLHLASGYCEENNKPPIIALDKTEENNSEDCSSAFSDASDFFCNQDELDKLSSHGILGDKKNLLKNSLFVHFDPLIMGRKSLAPFFEKGKLNRVVADPRRESSLMCFSPVKKPEKLNATVHQSNFFASDTLNYSLAKMADTSSLIDRSLLQDPFMDDVNSTIICRTVSVAVQTDLDIVLSEEYNSALKNQELVYQGILLRKSQELEKMQLQFSDTLALKDEAIGSLAQENNGMKNAFGVLLDSLKKLTEKKTSLECEFSEQLQALMLKHEQEVEELKMDNEAKQKELSKSEESFFECFQKYERVKQIVATLHKNEDLLKRENEEQRAQFVEKTAELKSALANMLDKMKEADLRFIEEEEAQKKEMNRAAMLLKRAEMKICSQNSCLVQKEEEIARLSKLLDEFTANFSS